MTVLALELNDSDIIVGRAADSWQSAGPGLALLDPGKPLLGEAARAQARLRPTRLHNRFWSELSVEPLKVPAAYAGSNADLACAQLADIWRRSDGEGASAALFLVPGSFGRDALGLLLGIAGECGIPARAVVDTAVASAEIPADGRAILHFDVHLHFVIVTEVLPVNGLARGELQVTESVGLATLEQAWAGACAEAFVRQTRFDPLHDAESEQALYDLLPEWLDALADGAEQELSLERGGQTQRATMTRRQLLEVTTPQYERIVRLVESMRVSRGPVSLQLSHRAARLPGLAERLGALKDVELKTLGSGRPVEGVLSHRDFLLNNEGPVRYVTTLPEVGAPPAPVPELPPEALDQRPAPTHLLNGTIAWALSESPLTLGVAPITDGRGLVVTGSVEGVSRRHCSIVRRDDGVFVEDHSRYGTFINGKRVSESARLHAGDVLRVGSPGSEFLLLEARD